MINIAICDDDKNDVNLIYNEIDMMFKEFNREIEIVKYYNPYTLIEKFEKCRYDLIFLDMAMPDINDGFKTAKELKKLQNDLNIVFVTSFPNTVDDVFFHKPVTFINKAKLSHDMQRYARIILEAVDNKSIYYIKDTIGTLTTINLNEIIYFESDKNYIKIHYKDSKSINLRMTLKSLLEINSNKIVQIHRSFVVSIENVRQIKNHEVIFNNGDTLSISSSYYDKAEREFLKYMR